MQYWDGSSAALTPLPAVMGGEEVRIERLTLIYERLWGAVTAGEPDRIYWSDTFAPDNWELNAAEPKPAPKPEPKPAPKPAPAPEPPKPAAPPAPPKPRLSRSQEDAILAHPLVGKAMELFQAELLDVR